MELNRKKRVFRSLVFLILILSIGSNVWAADLLRGEKKVVGKVVQDKALVYFICNANEQVNGINIYDEDKVLTVIKKNSYSFTYLEPGKHFLWWSGMVGNHIELVPGCTYYITLNYYRHTLLSETEGMELIKKVKYYMIPSSKEMNKATKYLKYYQKTLERYNNEKLIPIGDSPSQYCPLKETGKIKIPAFTEIKLQSLENISSAYNRKGDIISFKIREDVVIHNEVCFGSGTPVKGYVRQCEAASSFGVSSFYDIVITEVSTNGGSNIPVIGRIITSGITRDDTASAMSFMFGLLGGAVVKGSNCVKPYGSFLSVWTRHDAWITIPKNIPMNDSGDKGVSIQVTPLAIDAKCLTSKEYKLKVSLSVNKDIKEIKVGGNQFCNAMDGKNAISLKKVHGKWEAQFQAWDIIRYVNFNDPGNKIRLSGKFIDDTPFVAELQVNVIGKS